ncbi:hypothetical protein EYF88_08290 [Paracoccus sediminis]|uniref:Uncharacterized protein n=1 Tax=Paracoccus sediminis TaxID=1214787 RepID=A0A238WEB2_9RHOB|nr:hypothetical protein [Paracoccus sediminis]TBN50900.1 hypothetical protein EYF88_08290 [Paracoccus sediminis]SNR44922.1 hypothetical protein SAMN06265378_104123 [Paracoccus sediminis]
MANALFSIVQDPARPVRISPRPHRAAADMGIVMRTMQMAMIVPPVFRAADEPLADGRVYATIDGRSLARPDLALGQRDGTFPGPDVAFLKDIDGSAYLHIALRQTLPAGSPDGTETLGTMSGPPRIVWAGGEFVLPEPTPIADDALSGSLRILAPLSPDRVAQLVQAMTDPAADCALVAAYTASYRVREETRPVSVPRLPTFPEERPTLPAEPIERPRFPIRIPRERTGADIITVESMIPSADLRVSLATILADASQPGTTATTPARQISTALIGKSALISPQLLAHWKIRRIIDIPDFWAGPVQTEERDATASFTRRVPFFFDRTLDQNLGVFRAISGAATLPDDWQDSEWGTLCPAEFVNTVYLLPHEFRLAYDAARGLPHMLPVQYAAADGSRRLRVLLRTEPWYDPARVAGLQSALSRQSGGAFVHPQVIAGGVAGARLTLRTIFPEEIAVEDDAGAEGVAVDMISPFDLTLDLSEEYYALLVTILTGPVGLTGSVEVTLTPATDGAPAALRRVPLVLSFQRLGALPLSETVPTATINPERVDITNRAAQPVTIAGAEASLLLLDENALLPAAVLAARPAEALPLTLPPGGTTALTFGPVAAPEGAVWNTVVPVLTGVTAALDPDASLRAIHALAPPGSFGWQLRILSPQLAQAAADPGPDQMVAVEVRLTREGAAPVQATLMTGQAERVVTFPRPLNDLIPADRGGAASDGFLRLSVTARGVWPTGFGPFGDPADHVGDTLFVFVPPRDGGGP